MADPRPLRIAHLIAPVAFGGGEALLTDLLAATRPDLSESVLTIGRAPILAEALAGIGVECHAFGSREVGAQREGQRVELARSLAILPPLRAHLHRQRPDVIHAHGFPPSLLAAITPPRMTRRVYTHHYERQPPGKVETRVLTGLFDRYDALTTPADHLTAAMNRHFPALRHPFTTLRIGLSERFYGGRPQARWRELFPAGRSIGVCVGRLVETKNQQLIVDALATMPAAEQQRIGVLLVGEGPQGAELRSMVADAGLDDQIRFVGHVPREDMPDLLASVDFGVFPSTTEASSVAGAEALAAGLPILSLDIPSMVETIGAAGIFSTPDRFGADLVRMARDHATLAAAAREQGERSRVTRVRDQWGDLYRRVAGPPGPSTN